MRSYSAVDEGGVLNAAEDEGGAIEMEGRDRDRFGDATADWPPSREEPNPWVPAVFSGNSDRERRQSMAKYAEMSSRICLFQINNGSLPTMTSHAPSAGSQNLAPP